MVGGAHKQTHLVDADKLQVATIHPAVEVHELRKMKREEIEALKTAHANALSFAINFVNRLARDRFVSMSVRDEAIYAEAGEIVRQLNL